MIMLGSFPPSLGPFWQQPSLPGREEPTPLFHHGTISMWAFAGTCPRHKQHAVACILIFVLQPTGVEGVVPAGRPPVAEARFARIESLLGRSAPRPLLPGRGESEALGAGIF